MFLVCRAYESTKKKKARLADGAFHLHLDETVQFDRVFHRQFLDEEVEESVDDQRGCIGFAERPRDIA